MRIAVITGASSGLGVKFALEVDRQRADIDEIWLVARRRERLEEVADKLSKPSRILPLDLKNDESVEAVKAELQKGKNEVVLLINNAGYGKIGEFCDIDLEDNAGMVRLNCEALTALTCAVLPFMPYGSEIINTCSIASFAPNVRLAVYSSTKAYVMSFSRALREELKPKKINCLAVCPGPMDTEFLPVAGIEKGVSQTFDKLPRVLPENVARGSLEASKKKKAVYTNRFFYKFYRLTAKILPMSLVMKFASA